jgi:UDP-GlcNAc:undecaprenyl-phosphate GlcNAc-1-phosphate transferase
MLLDPNSLVAIGLTFLAAVASIVFFRRFAVRLGLLDHPGGRKQHERATPVVGGLAMAVALFVTWALLPAVAPPLFWVGAFLLFVLLGAIDDRLHLGASPKFLFQAFVAALAVAGSGISLTGLGEVVPGWVVHLGWLALPFTVFAIVSVMNAVNMSDGVDGLAGTLMVVALLALALAAGLAGQLHLSLLALVPCTALVAFLLFNLRGPSGRPARIFMGDAGSLGMGFLVAAVAVKTASPEHGGVPPAVVMWVCFVPLADGLTVILTRLSRRSGATTPGRDHLHHLLLDRGFSPRQVVFAEAGGGLLLALAALAGWRLGLPDWVFVCAFAGLLLAFYKFVNRSWAELRSPERFDVLPSDIDVDPEIVGGRRPG